MEKNKKEKAIKLRKQNKSYSEIVRILNVSKSTVSYWLKDIDWSEDIKKQLVKRAQGIGKERLKKINDLRKKKYSVLYSKAEIEATEEFEKLKSDSLFIIGISLYWGEGDKNFKNGMVRVSNVDYKLLFAFDLFLRQICKVDSAKIKAYLVLYPDLNSERCLKYWSKNIGIEESNFFKPSFIKGKHKLKRLGYGVCTINVSDKYLKKKILVWLDLFAKNFKRV